MAYNVIVANSNSNNHPLSPKELNKMRMVGGFSNAVLEASSIYQRMINQGALAKDIQVSIFEHGSEKLVAISASHDNEYYVQGVLGATSVYYEERRIVDIFSNDSSTPVFKKLPSRS